MANNRLFIQAALVCSVLWLLGCGGDSNSDDKAPVQPIQPIGAKDGYTTLYPGNKEYVSLEPWVVSEASGARVVSLRLMQDNHACSQPEISGLGFYIESDQEGSCRVDYVVESIPVSGQQASQAYSSVGLVSSKSEQADLPPIAVAISENQSVNIDLVTELGGAFPAGYVLSSALTVLGSGSAYADPAQNHIHYQANLEGLSRVIYSLENSDLAEPDVVIGYIDISVSGDATQPPVANAFTHSVQPSIGQVIDIDVIGHISDPDGDTLQLIDVQSFYANVTPTAPTDIANTQFQFSASQAGLHYVSYMVSDHRGGFSNNIVEVNVLDPSQNQQWSDIELGLSVYRAPLTVQAALKEGVNHSGSLRDGGYSPAVNMATFSADEAASYCSRFGRLPSSVELSDVLTQKDPTQNLNWPNQSTYLADDSGYLNIVDLSTGASYPYVKGYHYVTCYSDGALTADVVVGEVVADGIEKAVVDVSLILNGVPVIGEYIDAQISGSASLDGSRVVTDSMGVARFYVTSLVAESVNISLSYQNKGQISEVIKFIGNSDDSYLATLTIVQDSARADGIEVNKLTALVLDRLSNPVENVKVDVLIWEEDDNSSVVAPSSLTTNTQGEVYIEVSNSQQEYADIRAYYTSTNTPPEISFADQRVNFYQYNSLKPEQANGLLWVPPMTEYEALALEASNPNINFGPDMTHLEDGTNGPSGMVVARYQWINADDLCYFLDYAGFRDWRLPTEAELSDFYLSSQPEYSSKGIYEQFGWPTHYAMWSSDVGAAGYHRVVRLYDGNTDQALDSYSRYVSCVREM
ncbi:Ig-like domain-containing protein [Vibrio atypicus]|uniref:Ig-like domain-containing protein n=1 Tax=Vibrio atypicus TaxID=558271 RepID=UPI00135A5163|nr:Ig-like domain-containing protein [Vibrio atypicus]